MNEDSYCRVIVEIVKVAGELILSKYDSLSGDDHTIIKGFS